jgi:hypothetical protein
MAICELSTDDLHVGKLAEAIEVCNTMGCDPDLG